MEIGALLEGLKQFGPLGVLIAYLIWRENAERKDRVAQALARNEIDKAEISSRLDLTRTLTKLTMVVEWFIQGKPHV